MYIEMSLRKQGMVQRGCCPRCKTTGRMIQLPDRQTRLFVMRDVMCTECGKVVEVPAYLWDKWAKPKDKGGESDESE